jgi:hypothetical protein
MTVLLHSSVRTCSGDYIRRRPLPRFNFVSFRSTLDPLPSSRYLKDPISIAAGDFSSVYKQKEKTIPIRQETEFSFEIKQIKINLELRRTKKEYENQQTGEK